MANPKRKTNATPPTTALGSVTALVAENAGLKAELAELKSAFAQIETLLAASNSKKAVAPQKRKYTRRAKTVAVDGEQAALETNGNGTPTVETVDKKPRTRRVKKVVEPAHPVVMVGDPADPIPAAEPQE